MNKTSNNIAHKGTGFKIMDIAISSGPRSETKLELVDDFLLPGMEKAISWSSLDDINEINYSSVISDFGRSHAIRILLKLVLHLRSDGTISRTYLNWLADRNEASKTVNLIDQKRKQRGPMPLCRKQVDRCLAVSQNTSHPPQLNHTAAKTAAGL